MGAAARIYGIFKRYTIGEIYYRIREKMSMPYRDYDTKKETFWPGRQELLKQSEACQSWKEQPLISIVVPAFETPERYVRELVDSVQAQTYPNWELCIVDGSRTEQVQTLLQKAYGQESRITYHRLKENRGISGNTNQGFALARGQYVALLDHDDLLAPDALYEMAQAALETGGELFYSDEDKVNADTTKYFEPHFKLDYNEELLFGYNYICHLLMVSRALLDRVGGEDSAYDGAQDYDLVLRCTEAAERIIHVPKILYHWRAHGGSTAGNADSKGYARDAGKQLLEAALTRRGWRGSVEAGHAPGTYHIKYQFPPGQRITLLAWGDPSREWERVKGQMERELDSLEADWFWREEPDGPKPDRSWPEGQAAYVISVCREVKSLVPGSLARLLGSCHRSHVSGVCGKVVRRGKVAHCGYWIRESHRQPRFQGLPMHYEGYARRAALAACVDGLGRELCVEKTGAQNGAKLVEPAAQIVLRG